jgi:15-cis-phytoene synthase
MSAAADDKSAAGHCAELVRSYDFTRYASTLFVPVPERRALLALYAFNAEICRVHTQVSQPLPGEIRLQWWRDMLAGQGHGSVDGNPVAAELMLAIRTYRLPVERFSRLIEEHQFDLYNDPMPTMAALEGYLNDTSSALFSLAAALTGQPSSEVEHLARHAGLAQGIAQVIVSLPLDASQRRLFVPQQVLDRHGCDVEDVFAGRQTPRLREALNDILGVATDHLDTAFTLLASVAPDVRSAFFTLAQIKRDLASLMRADNDPFAVRLPSRLGTLWTLWRASRSRTFSRG